VGRRLRQAREARGLAADALAERLRLGVEQLEALEAGDLERLPEPVFVIAQARRIATVLQLDISAELQALRTSGELRPGPRPASPRAWQAADAAPPDVPPGDASSDRQPGAQPAEVRCPDPRLRSARARPLLVGTALLLALVAVWGGWRLRSGGPVPHGSPGASPSAAPAGRPAP
jgi:transcriptional regulator with XRE-family HTH domain